MVVDDRDALHLRRTQSVGDERDRVLGEFDDVDFLAPQLADDRLDARPFHADAGAHWIDIALAREHRDLCAVAGLPHRAANHDGSVVDFRHLLLEQLDEQCGIGPGQHDLRALGAAIHSLDDAADPIGRRVAFSSRLLLSRQDRFNPADFQDDVAVLEALDRPGDDLADALVVLGKNILAFSLTDFLEDDLLGRLRGDAPEYFGRLGKLHLVADLDAVGDLLAVERPVQLPGFIDADLDRGVGDVLNNLLDGEEVHLAGVGVESGLQILAGLVVLARGGRDRFFNGADDDVGLDALLLRQRLDCLLQRI